ncbi:MAG: EscU/YscU/HrcU family type III secretion system export apparatus switch protein, partial [Hydrogenophaga sp.]|uniref:EscU/YscU/HrcU family type III secretion system export apparatus switch protein n=1 Tax=Hydrogenophaga sp. TaxID=1904254 RepID=UPI004035AB4D
LPPLARAIYNTSQVKQQIPAALYQAAACAATLRGLGETVHEIGKIAARGEGAAVVVA